MHPDDSRDTADIVRWILRAEPIRMPRDLFDFVIKAESWCVAGLDFEKARGAMADDIAYDIRAWFAVDCVSYGLKMHGELLWYRGKWMLSIRDASGMTQFEGTIGSAAEIKTLVSDACRDAAMQYMSVRRAVCVG